MDLLTTHTSAPIPHLQLNTRHIWCDHPHSAEGISFNVQVFQVSLLTVLP